MDSIIQFLSSVPTWLWVLIGVLTAIGVIAAMQDETAEEDPDFLETTGMTDYITCSVPWQEVITFLPNQYVDYDPECYTGYVGITLKNGNSCLVPSQYTTVIDKSFKSLPQA